MQGWYDGSRMFTAWTDSSIFAAWVSHDLYQRSGIVSATLLLGMTLFIGAGERTKVAPDDVLGYMSMKKGIFMVILLLVTMSVHSQNIEQSLEAYGGISIDSYSKYSFGTSYEIGGTWNDRFHLGGGAGFRYTEALYYTSSLTHDKSYDGKFLIPVFARVSVNLTKEGVKPFLRCDLGYTFDVGQNKNKNTEGLFFHPAVGVDISTSGKSSLYFALGLNVQHTHYQHFGVPTETVVGYTSNLILSIGMKF